MWPFFVSLVFLYVTEKSFLHGHIITLKDSLPELYVLSLVLTVSDYADRAELSPEQKQEVAHYDNCTLYQDLICGQLFDKYRDKDMVIVFVSDHGENVYDDGHTLGRVHNDFSKAMIESQYEVPM